MANINPTKLFFDFERLPKDIYQLFYNEKKKSVFEPASAPSVTLPKSILDVFDFSLKNESIPDFRHASSFPSTHILHQLSSPGEDQTIFQNTYRSFRDWGCNRDYNRVFSQIPVTNTNEEDSEFSQFLNKLNIEVFKPLYGKNVSKQEQPLIPDSLAQESDMMSQDLFQPSTRKVVYHIQEMIDKMTDDERTNCFCLLSQPFMHPLNSLLSPAALGLSFFNYRQDLIIKQNKNKGSLPRVTYLSFTGIYSEIDTDILNACSDRIQIITLYDQSTGPAILSRSPSGDKGNLRVVDKNFQQISDKLLLIPLDCSDNKEGKSYGPNDILTIMEDIVIKSIIKFKSQYIVFNFSLTFDKSNQTPFYINEAALSRIILMLSQVCDHKVIVYPFKLPHIEVDKATYLFSKFLSNEKQQRRFERIFSTYDVPYNEEYFRNCFGNILEALADLRNPGSKYIGNLRKIFGVNPSLNNTLYQIGGYYRKHSYYHFLYCKSLNTLARIARDGLDSKPLLDPETRQIIDVPLYISGSTISLTKLQYQEREKTVEIVLDANSQYYVDYTTKEEPVVYVFNAKASQFETNSPVFPLPLSHLAIRFDEQHVNGQLQVAMFDLIEIETKKDILYVRDAGMCVCGTYVFQVYGTMIDKNNLDTNEICYFDFISQSYYKIEIQNKPREILPRHSVTACSFVKEGVYYLYVFGGKVHPNTIYRQKNLGQIDIIDIVEIYQSNNPLSSQWKYQILPKEHLFEDQSKSFIPFSNSFAFYNEDENKIFLMGGSSFNNSVNEWNFPVFEFDVKTNKFTSYKMFLNEQRNRSYRENGAGAPFRGAMAIAGKNKNFLYNKKDKTFKFVVPHKEVENLFCIYSYKYGTQECESEVISKKVESKNSVKQVALSGGAGFAPVMLGRMKAIFYMFYSNQEKKLLLEFIRWRLQECPDNNIEMIGSWLEKKRMEMKADESSWDRSSIALEKMEWFIKRYADNLIRSDEEMKAIEKFMIEKVTYELDKSDQEISLSALQFKDLTSFEISKKNDISSFELLSFPKEQQQQQQSKGSQKSEDPTKEKKKYEPILKDLSFMPIKESSSKIEEISLSQSKIRNQSMSIINNGATNESNVQDLKRCLAHSSISYHAFLNSFGNGATVVFPDQNQGFRQVNLRFRVISEGELEEISFGFSESSVAFYRDAVVCYIDDEFKKSHPHLYMEYRNWVLYANIGQALALQKSGVPKYLVFKKLFAIVSDERVFSRCLTVNQTAVFLFGGKSVKYKGKKNFSFYKSIAKYELTKLTEVTEQSSFLKDVEVDEMELNKGECISASNKDYIFVCQRENPKGLDIFNKIGLLEESVEFDFSTEGFYAHMNLVNVKQREEILIILYQIEKEMEFVLYDIEKKTFKRKVTLVQRDPENSLPSPFFYSTYERLPSNVGIEPLREIPIYYFRRDQPEIIFYRVEEMT